MGLYVPLDVTWPDDDDVIDVGLEGAGLHAITMCLAKRGGRDGWVGRKSLARYGGTPELVALLIGAGLIEGDDDRVRPVGWLKHNPSQAALEAKKEARRIAGKVGNHNRWHDGDYASCPLCKEPDPLVVAGCDTGAIASGSQPESDAIAKGEGKGECDRTSSHDATGSLLGFAGPKPAGLELVKAAVKSTPVGDNDATGAEPAHTGSSTNAVTA